MLHLAAKTFVVKEDVPGEEAVRRFDICATCEHRDPRPNKCLVCGCFLDLKTQAAVNWNPMKNRNEITHCPKGKWGEDDKRIANQYRLADGKEPLK